MTQRWFALRAGGSRGTRHVSGVCGALAVAMLAASSPTSAQSMVPKVFPAMPERTYTIAVASEATDEINIITFGPTGAALQTKVPIGLSATDPDGPHGLAASPDKQFYYVSTAHTRRTAISGSSAPVTTRSSVA